MKFEWRVYTVNCGGKYSIDEFQKVQWVQKLIYTYSDTNQTICTHISALPPIYNW